MNARRIYKNVHSTIVHNNRKWETYQVASRIVNLWYIHPRQLYKVMKMNA